MRTLGSILLSIFLALTLHANENNSLEQCFAAFLPELNQGTMSKHEMVFLEKVTRGIQMYELILAEAKNKGDVEKISETAQTLEKYSGILKDIYGSTEPPILYRMKKCLPNVMKNLVTAGVIATSLEVIFDYKKLVKNKGVKNSESGKPSGILQNF